MLTDHIMQLKKILTAPRADAKTPSGVIGKPSACGAYFVNMRKVCGIYKITNPTKRIYIGQSIDIRKRFREYGTLSCEKQLKITDK